MKIQEMIAVLTIGAMAIGNNSELNQSMGTQTDVAIVNEVVSETDETAGTTNAEEVGEASEAAGVGETGEASVTAGDGETGAMPSSGTTGVVSETADAEVPIAADAEGAATADVMMVTEGEATIVADAEASVATDELEGVEVLPVTYEFCEVDITYFDDALFIGDSRTDGLSRYGGLGEADVFASTGMNIYQLWNSEVMDENKELITLEDMLEQNDYSKIYITLGINEIDYSQKKTVERFTETIEKLQEYEPDAIIFLQSNLHVSKKRSSNDKIYNNDKINSLNEKIALLADNTNIFYIDCNELFNDDNGCLKSDLTYDGIHVYKKYYPEWVTWLLTKGIVKETTETQGEVIVEAPQEVITDVTEELPGAVTEEVTEVVAGEVAEKAEVIEK